MLSVQMSSPKKLSLAEVPKPVCEADGILMRIIRCSVCATDVSYYDGHLIPEAWPIIPGHEFLGEVVESRNKDIKEGDKIMYFGGTDFGGLAEYRALRPLLNRSRVEAPWFTYRGFMDDYAAAATVVNGTMVAPHLLPLLEPTTAILRSLLHSPPPAGEGAVILGGGTTGLLALQFMKRCQGVGRVIVMERNKSRRELALRLGADEVYDPDTSPDAIHALIQQTQGAAVGYVFDTLPDSPRSTQDQKHVRTAAMHLVRPGGTYVLFGATSLPQQIDTWMLLSKGINVRAAGFDVRIFPMWKTAEIIDFAHDLFKRRTFELESLVSHEVVLTDLESLEQAFTGHAQGERMKTVVRFDDVVASK